MVNINNHDFKSTTDKIVKEKESLINSCVNECLKSEIMISSNQCMCKILDKKYKNEDPNKVTTKKCQSKYIKDNERIISLLRNSYYLFDSMLGMWNITRVKL